MLMYISITSLVFFGMGSLSLISAIDFVPLNTSRNNLLIFTGDTTNFASEIYDLSNDQIWIIYFVISVCCYAFCYYSIAIGLYLHFFYRRPELVKIA